MNQHLIIRQKNASPEIGQNALTTLLHSAELFTRQGIVLNEKTIKCNFKFAFASIDFENT